MIKKLYLNTNQSIDLSEMYSFDNLANTYVNVTLKIYDKDYASPLEIYKSSVYITDDIEMGQSLIINYGQIIRDYCKSNDYFFHNFIRPDKIEDFKTSYQKSSSGDPYIDSGNPNNRYMFICELIVTNFAGNPVPSAGGRIGWESTMINIPEDRADMYNEKNSFIYTFINDLDQASDPYVISFNEACGTPLPRVPYIVPTDDPKLHYMAAAEWFMSEGFTEMNQEEYAMSLLDAKTREFLTTPRGYIGYDSSFQYWCMSGDEMYAGLNSYFGQPEMQTIKSSFILSWDIDPDDQAYPTNGKVDLLRFDMGEDISEWYIQWQDDYGLFQSQPLYGKVAQSFEYERLETVDGDDFTHVQNVTETTKWSLYTGYLTEKEYKYWRNLYSARYIYLYNTKINRGWWVKVEDTSALNKKYSNDGMIYMNINIEAINKNIL